MQILLRSGGLHPAVTSLIWFAYMRRTLFLCGVAGLTAAAAALSSTSNVALLWAAAPLAGFAFGCHWSLMPPLAGEVCAPGVCAVHCSVVRSLLFLHNNATSNGMVVGDG